MKEAGTQAVIQIPAKNKLVWEPIVDAAQALCKNKDLFCGICIRWKELTLSRGAESVVFMTIAATTHPATSANKAQLAEVVKKVMGLAASAA